MKNFFIFPFFCLASLLFFGFSAYADVKLPRFFSSDMMLQRDIDSSVWGWADPGEQVKISIHNQSIQVKADEKGKWKTKLKPMAAGGPYTMIVRGKNTITLENILVGDIWLCSGQSNMEWPVQLSLNGKEEVAAALHPEIRILSVPQRLSLKAEKDLEARWQVCSPATIAGFSAVGYFFGRSLQDSLEVPIGLIDASWGGSMIEPWISANSLQEVNGAAQKIQANKEKDRPGQFRKEILALKNIGTGRIMIFQTGKQCRFRRSGKRGACRG